MDLLTEYHKDRIKFVADYIKDGTTDWFIVKRHILNAMSYHERKRFTTRHPNTKKHTTNEFEVGVREYWKELTGVSLVLNPAKMHDPNWIQRPREWMLLKLIEERRQKKHEQLSQITP